MAPKRPRGVAAVAQEAEIELAEPVNTDVRCCARCMGDHDQLEFRPLTYDMTFARRPITHWASCPTNGEPILMSIGKSA